MTLHELNNLPIEKLKQALFNCCGSNTWVNNMLQFFPADDMVELLIDAEDQWYQCPESDWLEAFSHHPPIGDIKSLSKKFADTAQWASSEQSKVNQASIEIINTLAEGNHTYLQKFGFIFIVCATGKTASEMLTLLESRLPNDRQDELKIAMDEQNKITQLRIQKLLA